MTGKLPIVSGRETVAAMEKAGYVIVRQRGSHIRLRHTSDGARKPLTVPAHKQIKQGLLRKIIKDANLTVEEFSKLLKK
ncbi:MAG: type II toxin-antitoxin system HicA family toxin [Chloroflexi bacterium]|nr:type II toxin-antitoxin system HicA family toxin [Chloroflexota bacterium]